MRLIVGKSLRMPGIGRVWVGASERLPKLEKHHRWFAAGFSFGFFVVPVGLVAWALLHAPVVALIHSLAN